MHAPVVVPVRECLRGARIEIAQPIIPVVRVPPVLLQRGLAGNVRVVVGGIAHGTETEEIARGHGLEPGGVRGQLVGTDSQELRYIYVTEDKHGDGRVHHHLVINGTGHDLDELRALWPDGHIHVQNLRPREFGYLARYLTKEAREYGKQLGKKTWVSSRGLKRPVQPKAEVVPDLMTLTVPPNADPLESSGGEVRLGEFGCYAWIKYIYRDPEDYRLPREVSGDPEEDLTAWRRERPKPTTPYKN